MDKINLFLDFDGVIVDSLDAACETYNHLFQNFDEFVPAQADKCKRYDMADVCPLCNGSPAILFSQQHFFDVLKPTQEDVCSYLDMISEYYNIIVTSLGTTKNVQKKTEWIEKNLPMIKQSIMLVGDFADKNNVNMTRSVIVDDVSRNLHISNAAYRIVFGKTKPWNDNHLVDVRALDFKDLYDILVQYYKTCD